MGDIESEATDERLAEISNGLLWEWWTTSTQAIVDAVGTEMALKALRPYYLNANNAAAQISTSYFTELAKDPDFMVKMIVFAMETWFGSESKIQVSDDLLILDIYNCRTKGECKELCQMTCKELMDNQAQNMNPEAFAVLEKSLSKGDDSCRILIGTKEGLLGRDSKKFREVDRANINNWEFRSFQIQYLSESWVFTTRAAIDVLGAQAAREKLCAYLRRSGLSYGISALRVFEGKPKETIIKDSIRFINGIHLKKGKTRSYDVTLEEEVQECPFSQAPQEVCLQYEAFFNGVCDAIDPEYEFRYHHMMTDGDESCNWILKKRLSRRDGR
jgi:hypothetical protein